MPIQLSRSHEAVMIKNIDWAAGQNLIDIFLLCSRGGKYKIIMADKRTNTPPSLFGTDRRIAYSHRKYHSG